MATINQNTSVYRGASRYVQVLITGDDGPLNIEEVPLTYTVSKHKTSPTPYLVINDGDMEKSDNLVEFTISESDSVGLPYGYLHHELFSVHQNGNHVFMEGTLVVKKSQIINHYPEAAPIPEDPD
jgi:hypothetical protein